MPPPIHRLFNPSTLQPFNVLQRVHNDQNIAGADALGDWVQRVKRSVEPEITRQGSHGAGAGAAGNTVTQVREEEM